MRVLSSSYVVFGVLIGTLLILSWQTEPCDSSSSSSRVLIWVPSVSVELQQKVSHRWSKSLMATIWASAASKQQQIKGGDEQKRLFLLKAKYYNRLSYWCSTTTVTTTSTTTISTKTFCATINGVVGACRRRKKLLIEDDDDLLADSVTNQHHLVQPTESLSLETTASSIMEGNHPASGTADLIIQSSMITAAESAFGRKFNTSTKLRFFPLLSCYLSHPFYTTVTTNATSYVYTTTQTFTLTNCIPQPFSYAICSTIGGK